MRKKNRGIRWAARTRPIYFLIYRKWESFEVIVEVIGLSHNSVQMQFPHLFFFSFWPRKYDKVELCYSVPVGSFPIILFNSSYSFYVHRSRTMGTDNHCSCGTKYLLKQFRREEWYEEWIRLGWLFSKDCHSVHYSTSLRDFEWIYYVVQYWQK